MTSLSPVLLAGLSLFALVSSLTPGPNNMMLLASGANFGLRRTIPHLMGVSLGFVLLVWIVGLGLGAVFAAWPPLHAVLQILGGLYLAYLAWKIATASGIGGGASAARPMTFLQAAAFQWVNPKAWAMALGATTTYAPQQHYVANILVVGAVFGAINMPCVALWASLGTVMRRFLSRPGILRLFNYGMAALLLISLYPVVGELMRASGR
ncbi:MAG TPA: LysE family translocator [Caulobacteraceae bacterium]|jgi:threonine/homoserine/homoserine lactone efflux protein|nr:LysE family translocator [Caulobacteraceae bacterium]